jgi:IS1 family transposase
VNVLPRAKRIAVLHALVNGNSERSAADLAGVNRETVGKLNLTFGEGAQRFHDRIARNLSCTEVIADEAWSYAQVKAARVKPTHRPGSGEAYIFTGMNKPSRFLISWLVGRRDEESAKAFMADMRARMLVMPEICTDGFAPYVMAVREAFGPGVDYSMMMKNYSAKPRRDDQVRYEPPRGIDFITRKVVFGAPDLDHASTAYIERNNATLRHMIGRMRRLVFCFSKRIENHRASCALACTWYNVGHIVRTTRVTPALAEGVLGHVLSIEEFHDIISEEGPCEKPQPQPLAHRRPETTHRALPGGGFLRVVRDRVGAPVAPTPPAPAVPAAEPEAADASGQLDLLAWRPKPGPALHVVPRSWEQLDLFGPNENQPK